MSVTSEIYDEVKSINTHLGIYWTKQIIDNDGNIAPVNTDGEICLRGYNVFKGYWDEPAKTAEIIDKNGWLHSGGNNYNFQLDKLKNLEMKPIFKDIGSMNDNN